MKAIRKLKEGAGFVEMCDIPEPKCGKTDVKIKVEAVGICGTDIKIEHGTTWSNPPVTLGHELSGVVAEVGEDVRSVKVGDRVIASKYAGTAVKLDGVEYTILSEDDILATVN